MPLTTRARPPGYRLFWGGRGRGGGRLQLAAELDPLCGVENFYSAQGERSYHVLGSVYGKAPTRQLHSTPVAVSGSGHTGNLSSH